MNNSSGRNTFVQGIINLFPKSFRLRFNPRRYEIETFVQESARKIPKGSKILDAGAGPCPYKPFFSHCKYEATDFENPDKILDFISTIDKIPKKADSYDFILCTEVLEHIDSPEAGIKEMHRVLKKHGKLFITCPQEYMIHQAPHNYFYFTKYGLISLLKKAGFKKYTITPMGGYPKFLADAFRFNDLADQYKNNLLAYIPLKILDLIFFKTTLPFILFHLDCIDKKQNWTMGYLVEATK